ncbi:competence protein CoiA family protein [Haloarcula sebkhae]|uniref:Competence protein CoiA family protein n=2 Tax=Haloarcula sebkhae TaxID=932660 RepID=A0ACC6VNL0_9EURY|nr:competence protein CoiA family protein [Haloarcula sebkhae]
MPFIAVDPVDNRPRIPVGVGDDEGVQCPVCQDALRVRDGPSIARHFYHPPDSDCSGESPLHLRMKSIAVDKVQKEYPDATVHVEFVTDEVPRRADVFVEFEHPKRPLGSGIAVEVQYQNEQKDFVETTASYLDGGCSVIWLFEENYVGTHPDYEDVELPEPLPVWPFGVPHGEPESPDTPIPDYLGVTESELIEALPNHVDGQVTLTDFPATPEEEEEADPLPEWSREKALRLSLSVDCPGVQAVHRAWLEGKIQHEIKSHRGTLEDRRDIVESEARTTYFSHRFTRDDGDTFELSVGVTSSENGELIIRSYSGTGENKLRSPAGTSIATSLTEFAMDICYVLECIDSATTEEWSKQIDSKLCELCYVVSPASTEAASVKLEGENNTMELPFSQSHRQPLLELCAKVRLWHDCQRVQL